MSCWTPWRRWVSQGQGARCTLTTGRASLLLATGPSGSCYVSQGPVHRGCGEHGEPSPPTRTPVTAHQRGPCRCRPHSSLPAPEDTQASRGNEATVTSPASVCTGCASCQGGRRVSFGSLCSKSSSAGHVPRSGVHAEKGLQQGPPGASGTSSGKRTWEAQGEQTPSMTTAMCPLLANAFLPTAQHSPSESHGFCFTNRETEAQGSPIPACGSAYHTILKQLPCVFL